MAAQAQVEPKKKIGNIDQIWHEHEDDLENPKPRIYTGFHHLDECLKGIRLTDFTLIAGGTGEFKSTVSGNLLINCAKQGIPVALYNYEMSSLQSLRRFLCSEACLPLYLVEEMNQDEKVKAMVDAQAELLINNSIYMIDKGIDTVEKLLHDISVKSSEGVKVFVIDYIQLINSDKGSRVDQIEYVTRRLRNSALENNCIIVGISQLSRQHKRDGKEPELHDMKGSGGLENDATQVVFVVTKNYSDLQKNKGENAPYVPRYRESSLVIKKNRHGMSNVRAECIVIPSFYKFINVDFEDNIGENNLPEAVCTSCNSERFYMTNKNHCHCMECKEEITDDCSHCNDGGLIFYEKGDHHMRYNYVGLCPYCPRGRAIAASIVATNSTIENHADRVGILPFVKKKMAEFANEVGI